jgi:septal ring factor EnvC (AmiA/AmiB activator)
LADITIHIKQVNAKLQLLLAQYSKLQHENEQQKKLIETLKQTDAQQKEKLEALRQEQLILKASIDKMDEAEKKELEQKINGYIKNIDKCISLLSHKSNVQ